MTDLLPETLPSSLAGGCCGASRQLQPVFNTVKNYQIRLLYITCSEEWSHWSLSYPWTSMHLPSQRPERSSPISCYAATYEETTPCVSRHPCRTPSTRPNRWWELRIQEWHYETIFLCHCTHWHTSIYEAWATRRTFTTPRRTCLQSLRCPIPFTHGLLLRSNTTDWLLGIQCSQKVHSRSTTCCHTFAYDPTEPTDLPELVRTELTRRCNSWWIIS